jgi:hypothetical protein
MASLHELFGVSGLVFAVLTGIAGAAFWIALCIWAFLVYRERRSAAGGSTTALLRPWMEPMLLLFAVIVGAAIVASVFHF